MAKEVNYENTAVNLCNPDEVRDLLIEKHRLENLIQGCQKELEADEVYLQMADHQKALDELGKSIKAAIEEFGSYQELGQAYAVKYARKTKGYNLEPFKSNFPKFVGLCVRESIDVTALNGQIKGKLITEKELEDAGVLDYTTNYAFYVR